MVKKLYKSYSITTRIKTLSLPCFLHFGAGISLIPSQQGLRRLNFSLVVALFVCISLIPSQQGLRLTNVFIVMFCFQYKSYSITTRIKTTIAAMPQ